MPPAWGHSSGHESRPPALPRVSPCGASTASTGDVARPPRCVAEWRSFSHRRMPMRRLIALALVVALTLALTAPAAEARHGYGVVVGIGEAVGLVLVAPF